MKTILTYDIENNLINQTLHGKCSVNNLAEVFDEMEKLNLKPGLKILADITDADLHEANYDSISILENRLDKFLNIFLPIRKAIFVQSNLEFGIARMYQILSEKDGFDVGVFRNKEKALTWLHETY